MNGYYPKAYLSTNQTIAVELPYCGVSFIKCSMRGVQFQPQRERKSTEVDAILFPLSIRALVALHGLTLPPVMGAIRSPSIYQGLETRHMT